MTAMPEQSAGPPGPDGSPARPGFPALEALIGRMEALLDRLRERRDPRRFFHGTYLRTTRAVGAELAAGGFLDPAWVERWDVVFAELYLDVLEAGLRGGSVPRPWAEAFAAASGAAPVRHVLLGMNAHINYDLPQALLAVISDEQFGDPAMLDRREADHRRIDGVLAALVDRADALPETDGSRAVADRLIGRANCAATKRFLTESRAKVWANARVLALARQLGPAAYEARRAELERLAAERVADLTRPGPVLLRLAVRGFGVALSPPPLRRPPGFRLLIRRPGND